VQHDMIAAFKDIFVLEKYSFEEIALEEYFVLRSMLRLHFVH